MDYKIRISGLMIAFYGVFCACCSAQRVSRSDSLLYRAVFCDSIYFDVDYEVAKRLYGAVKDYSHDSQYNVGVMGPPIDEVEDFRRDPGYMIHTQYIKVKGEHGDTVITRKKFWYANDAEHQSNLAGRQKGDRMRVREYAMALYEDLHVAGYDREKDKCTMKRLLKTFRSQATTLPTLYGLIDKKYKGNVDAYVDALFEKSIFSTEKKLKRFMKVPRLGTLLKDPAILYMVSKLQYEVLLQAGAQTAE